MKLNSSAPHSPTLALIGSLICAGHLTVLAAPPILPDPQLTPGRIALTDQSVICSTQWGKDERHVSASLKKKVFLEYHISWSRHAKFEVDHLVSRELGGADEIENLWPQSYSGTWNARVKDRLENRLHKLVCANQISLAQAQAEIATDWIAAFKKYFPR